MKMLSKLVACGAAGLALAFAAATAQAVAIDKFQTFNFTGFCEDCPGVPNADVLGSTAKATLVLKNYTGDRVNGEDNFVSFTYTSTLMGTLNANADDLINLFGSFDEVPGFLDVFLEWRGGAVETDIYTFKTCGGTECVPGVWSLTEAEGPLPDSDHGINGIWTAAAAPAATPEPASLALLLLGLAGLGVNRRLRR